jgi:hypothetical protein
LMNYGIAALLLVGGTTWAITMTNTAHDDALSCN